MRTGMPTHGKPVVKPNDMFAIHNDFIEIKELTGLDRKNENELVVYRTQYPDVFNLQLRTFKPSNYNQNGKPKNMMAVTGITIQNVEDLLSYMKTLK